MKRVTLGTAAVLAALACAGAGNLLSGPAAAQSAPAPAPSAAPPAGAPPAAGRPGRPAQDPAREAQRRDPTRHLEGRIAFLKAELKITDAQNAQWEKVAQAMRQNAQSMKQTMDDARNRQGQTQSAADQIVQRARFSQARAVDSQRLADAFKPLYDSLSADQKKQADDLFASHRHAAHKHHHGGPDRGGPDHGPRRG